MRVVDCECGAVVQGATDAELARQVRRHVEEEHPGMELDDEAVEALVAKRAYDASDA